MSGDQQNEFVFVFKLLAKNDIWSFIPMFHSSDTFGHERKQRKKV